MQGTITGWHVLRHPVLIVKGFGPGCYLRCVVAVLRRERTTFLDASLRSSGLPALRFWRSRRSYRA